MEKLSKETTRGVNAQVIAEKCNCTASTVYNAWSGFTGKFKTELYLRIINLTKKVAAAYDEPQL